jgi:hypothetical protein
MNAEVSGMSETAAVDLPPSRLAHAAAHVVIGLLVGGLTHLVFRQKVTVAIVAALIGVLRTTTSMLRWHEG